MTCIWPAPGPGRAGALQSLSGQADRPNYSLQLSYTSEYSTAQENKETASFTSNILTRFFLLIVFLVFFFFICLFFILAVTAL